MLFKSERERGLSLCVSVSVSVRERERGTPTEIDGCARALNAVVVVDGCVGLADVSTDSHHPEGMSMKLVEGTVTIHPSQTWPDKHAVHLSHGQSCVVCHLHPRPTRLAEEGSGCAAATTHTTRSLVSSINLKPRKIRSNPAGKKDSLACLSERSTKKSERRSNDAKTNHKKHTADTTQDKTTTQKAPTDPSVAFLSLCLSLLPSFPTTQPCRSPMNLFPCPLRT